MSPLRGQTLFLSHVKKEVPYFRQRDDIAIGQRVFHDKFGYGEVVDQEGNKLEIEFEQSGRKRVIDSFVRPA